MASTSDCVAHQVLVEMFFKFGTAMERAKVLPDGL